MRPTRASPRSCLTLFQWSSICMVFVITISYVFYVLSDMSKQDPDDEIIKILKRQVRSTTLVPVHDLLKLERYNGSALEEQDGLLSPLLIQTEEERKLLQSYQNAMAPKKQNGLKIQVMKLRAETLKQRCAELQDIRQKDAAAASPQTNEHVFLIPQHKLAICVNHNVASSNLYRAILILTGAVNTKDPMAISDKDVLALTRKRNTSHGISETDLSGYKKVVFVREPMERILSIFIDKFKRRQGEEDIDAFKHTIVGIKKRLYPQREIKTPNSLYFEEFVRYILHPDTIREGYDSQWDTYTSACTPCEIHYDYVGTCNTFEQELIAVLLDVGSPIVHFPANSPLTETDLVNFYKKIHVDRLVQLKNIYAVDSFLFDYTFPPFIENMLLSN